MRLRARLPLAALTLPIGLAVLGSCHDERATEPGRVLNPTMSTLPEHPLNGADISNGTVRLGVSRVGHLQTLLQDDPLGFGFLSLRYVPTGAAGIEGICPCEGWGIMDLELGNKGGADGANGIASLDIESFTFDATSATSVVRNTTNVFRVTHAFRPSPVTPYLYEITVTMKNISIFSVRPMYRRVMDWDISDSPAEWLTLKRGTTIPMRTDNNGENSWELPFFQSAGRFSEDFEDDGPFKDDRPGDPSVFDHGALFDLVFAPIAPGEEKTFRLFYGAAGTEAAALAALAAVGAEAYSLAQPGTEDGRTLGTPQTFMFGFSANTNRAPNANAGADQTRECTSHNGATVRLDGTGSSDPDGAADIDSYEWYEGGTLIATGAQPEVTLGLGRHRLALRVKDKQGATAEDEVDITVQDTQAPTIDLTADPAELWPPNHEMVSVARGISASDICDMSPRLVVTVTSNEPVDGLGDGDTSPDSEVKDNGNGTFDVLVRSERSGKGDGRVYTISVTSTDASGNTSSRTATVKVPHDEGTRNK